MRELIRPINPYHRNPYTEEDLWWADDAWNSDTLEFFVKFAHRFGDEGEAESENEQLISVVKNNVMSNLPKVIPDGEWCVDYLLKATSPRKSLEEQFTSWGLFPELSRPVRLYLYLCPKVGQWDYRDGFRRLLLMTADFTAEDVQFLFVDGGVHFNMESREEVRKLYADDMSLPETLASSALMHGALRRSDIEGAIANHSLASSSIYRDLVDVLIRDVTDPSEIPTSRGHQALRLLLMVAANPAAPIQVLERLVSGLSRQINATAESFKAESGNKGPVLSSTALREMGKICHAILYHPNWDGRRDDTLALASNVSAGSTSRGPGFALPTADDRPCDPNSSNDTEGLLRLYAFRAPRDQFVKDQVRSIVAECTRSLPVEGKFRFSDRYYEAGYGMGYYLRLMAETRESFEATGNQIPDEWIAELTF